MSHYLSPPGYAEPRSTAEAPQQTWQWPAARLEVARHTAALLQAMSDHEPPPLPPSGLDDDLASRLARVRRAVIDIVRSYEAEVTA
jgi:hypothetical protein